MPGRSRRDQGQMCVVVAELRPGDGQVLVRNLHRRGSRRVLLLARRAGRPELVTLLAGGLRGAVTADSGSRPYPEPVTIAAPVTDRLRPDLTELELTVLRLVADGFSNRALGEKMGVSALTVKSHLARISRKLGIGDRAALVAIAIRTGLIT